MSGDAIAIVHLGQQRLRQANSVTELLVPAAQRGGFVDPGERRVGRVDDARAGELPVDERVQVTDEVDPPHARALVSREPRPGRRADAAGERSVAGDAEVTR